MYQSKSEDIYGIWFYNEDDCVGISKEISSLVHASGVTKNRRQRCVSESDSQFAMKSKNGKSSDRDITAILTNAQLEFNQRNSSSTALKNAPSLQRALSHDVSSLSTEKPPANQKTPSTNENSVKNQIQSTGSSLVTPRQRFPSSGTPVLKPSCSKQLFESPSRDLPSLTHITSSHEARSQFLKSRALSLDSTPKKNIFPELLGERQDSDLESKSPFARLAANSFTSSANQIPEETSPPFMTPEMFEQGAVSPLAVKKTPCLDKPPDPHSPSAFPKGMNWKDQHASGIHQMAAFPSTCTSSKSVYSPQDFQNIHDNAHGNGFVTSDELKCPVDNAVPCSDSQMLPKEQLANSLMYLLRNDSSMLSKIHEAYISSLKTHLNNFKK